MFLWNPLCLGWLVFLSRICQFWSISRLPFGVGEGAALLAMWAMPVPSRTHRWQRTQQSFLPREFTADFLPPWWPVVGFFTTSRVILQVAERGCLRALFFCLVPSFVILVLERLFPYSRTTELRWNVQRRLACNESKVTRHLGLFSMPLLKFFYSFILYWKKVKVLVAQSCPTLCDPMDCSPPGSSVHGILQAGVLERVAMPSSRGSCWPWDHTWLSHIADKLFTVWATREAHFVLSIVDLQRCVNFYCTESVSVIYICVYIYIHIYIYM